jgi:hypothetical protein
MEIEWEWKWEWRFWVAFGVEDATAAGRARLKLNLK